MSGASGSGGVCWWCCMRVLERCLPRNDIVRELAPYLQHVHRDDGVDEEMRHMNTIGRNTSLGNLASRPNGGASSLNSLTSNINNHNNSSSNNLTNTTSGGGGSNNSSRQQMRNVDEIGDGGARSPRDFGFVQYEDQSVTSSGSHHHAPLLHLSNSVEIVDDVDELVGSREAGGAGGHGQTQYRSGETTLLTSGVHTSKLPRHLQPPTAFVATSPRLAASAAAAVRPNLTVHHSLKTLGNQPPNTQPPPPLQQQQGETQRRETPITVWSVPTMTADNNIRNDHSAPLTKKSSAPKIKTELGDLVPPVRWEKVVLVQVSVQGFREMMGQARDLMDEAKMLYEHTVLSRLSNEYGGQEVLSHSRSGLFVIAFNSEFHAAKWCLSLQLSLVYAAWNDKLLKQFSDMREESVRPQGRSRKPIMLYRGFRVRMVIHAADSDVPTEKSLADAVKWTNTVSEFAYGGQIILSDSVWDRLKEQLVQLGNPVVEDLGCHMVLKDEVMLMLLLPRDLEFRRFDRLKSPHQLAPGMRDAPSAQKALTMVFTFIEGARPLVRCHAEELADRIKTLCNIARKLLRKHNGYECQELQGDFMLAFFNPVCAVMWCVEFQLRIREKFRQWNRDQENQELMFSMSMGIETGVPASVSPHKTSGRADYFGNIVNQTARIAKAAHGGQILIGGDAWNSFHTCDHRSTLVTGHEPADQLDGSTIAMFKFHGHYAFKGISLPIALIEAVPVATPISRGENIRILLSGTRVPKAKLVEGEGSRVKTTAITPVPSEMVKLLQKTERERDTIRETELGSELGSINVSWDDNIPIVEEQGSFDEEADIPSPMVGSDSRLNHSGLMSALRSSLSSSSNNSTSPRAVRTERMDRV